jgi:NAD(P)H dehydrogenase (quinone)
MTATSTPHPGLIAVTGATGALGRLVIAELLARGQSAETVVALARTPSKADDLGVPVRQADYSTAETLPAALKGVSTLLLISSSEVGQRVDQHRAVLQAAKAAGVAHIVYTSLLHADRSPMSLADEHRTTEADLAALGVPYTLLRNGWYTENYTGSIAGALAAGAFIGCAAEGKISSAPRHDYAAAAARVLITPALQGKTYELAGDSAYTLGELAAELSRQSGKDIPYQNLPQADYAQILAGLGLPEGLAQGLASWDVDAAHGALFDDGGALSQVIGRPTTPLATTIAQTLRVVG